MEGRLSRRQAGRSGKPEKPGTREGRRCSDGRKFGLWFCAAEGAGAEGRTMPSHRVREAGARQEPLKIQAPKLGSNKRSHGISLAFLHGNVNQLARFQVIPVMRFMY
ncbi:hypothetical protein O206_17175 [Ochrobactrum sp. EGD-AQ16]|nr:hypothetical protein O206_17175 [Ochrobactrum sp. EGD-AQ16]